MNILFVCSGNSVRSQMAEGWARHLSNGNINVKSAGIFVGNLHPMAVEVMGKVGIDISHHDAKPLNDRLIHWADILITVCDSIKQCAAVFPKSVILHHWSIPNPDALINDILTQKEAYEQVRDELRDRIEKLIAEKI